MTTEAPKPKRRISAVCFVSATSFGATGLVVSQTCDSLSASELGVDIVRSTGPTTNRRVSCHFVPWSNVADVTYALEDAKAKAA